MRAQEKKEGGGPDLPDLPEIPTPSSGGKSLFDQVDDFGRKISKETQEASGLDARKLGQQPGDKTGVQFGKEDTPKGEVGQVMSFAGLIPETTNGRAAMVAMLAAFIAEVTTHQPVPVQIQKEPFLVVGTFILVIAGSLAPVVRGTNLDRNGWGPFNQRAEIWNGRLAMVAFTVLLLVETFRDGPALVP